MTTIDWQGDTGAIWAANWKQTDRAFTMVTEELLRRTRDFSFNQVLDVGCGAGELSLAIARGRPSVEVLGVDISPSLLAAARERGHNHANVSFVEADATTWKPEPGFSPGLVTSRHGVMFFADPTSAFANLAATAATGAGLLFSCFRSPAENPTAGEILRLLPNPPPPESGDAGRFAFSDQDRVRAMLGAAGWSAIEMVPYDYAMIVGAGEDPVRAAVDFIATIGPGAAAIGELDIEARDRYFGRLENYLSHYHRDGLVALPAAAWIVTARND